METKIICLALVLGSFGIQLSAQWNWPLSPGGNKFGYTLNPNPANSIRSIGVGDFPGNGAVTSAYFHINQFYLLQSPAFAAGQMIRTDANAANFSAWRMFTGATAATTNEKFSLVVPALSNNVIQQSSRGDMFFNTAGSV